MERDRPRLLLVDDTPENIHLLGNVLSEDYQLSVARSGPEALAIAGKTPYPDLILLDIMMPGMDGYEVSRRLKENDTTSHIPIIFITAKAQWEDEVQGFGLGAVDYITKPISPPRVKARVETHLELKYAREALANQNVILEEMVRQRTRELETTREVTIYGLATLAEFRDNETGGHIIRTQEYVKVLAEYLADLPGFRDRLPSRTIELIYKSAPLHDIGKVGVPDRILLKPAKLTPEEFDIMKNHTLYGHEAITRSEVLLTGAESEIDSGDSDGSFLHFARELTVSHHEKWDGSGYPNCLAGEDIPLSGRLMALADVYDALISKRVYKPAFSHEKARGIILEGKGRHFDPLMVDAFTAREEMFQRTAREHVDSE